MNESASSQRYSGNRSVLILGGGRWGRTIASVLSKFDDVRQIFLVSRRYYSECIAWRSEVRARFDSAASIEVMEDPEEVPSDVQISFVATRALDHAAAAELALRRGLHVLVEKPIAANPAEADHLMELATERGLVLGVDHEFLFASYLHDLRSLMDHSRLEVLSMAVRWLDEAGGHRLGGVKLPDLSVSSVLDLYPHVLSILAVVLGRAKSTVVDVDLKGDVDGVVIQLQYGGVPVSVDIARNALRQRRSISADSSDGPISLDFTREPGSLAFGGRQFDTTRSWQGSLRPLEASLRSFLNEIDSLTDADPLEPHYYRDFVTETASAEHHLGLAARELLLRYVARDDDPGPSVGEIGAMRPHLVPVASKSGLISDCKDRNEVDRWTSIALRLIHRMSVSPFATQRDLASELHLSRHDLITLNGVLRSSELAQELILSGVHGSKYWRNTIVPLVQTGAIARARSRRPVYPMRVGLYPGPACMFYCSFCGRNYDAAYNRPSAYSGVTTMKRLFEESPANDDHRFYISGGLEPLTNPVIGSLVHAGAARGFNLSMYTNGYMLTPSLLERQPGLWELGLVRISLYGPDAIGYQAVTGKGLAFERVIQNAKEFLHLRNRRSSPIRLGFNYVLLPGRSRDALRIVELIEDINRFVAPEEGLNFLTFREDYSVPPERGIPRDERAELVSIFGRIQEKASAGDLGNLEIDWGYGLSALAEGSVSRPLEMITPVEMRPEGFPTISVVVDLLGDVYMYREAGFLDRPGARRYCIGKIQEGVSLRDVVARWVETGQRVNTASGDTQYMDIFDHVVTNLLNQADHDENYGIPFESGPVNARIQMAEVAAASLTLAHPTLATV